MKVWIGKHRHWSLFDLVKAIASEAVADWIWEIEAFQKVHHWLLEKTPSQVIKVKLDPWDTWNLDYTLAHMIHPGLVQLKAENHGIFAVDNEDVPVELRTEAEDDDIKWHYCEKRYNWVMDEMIWAFEQIKNNHDGINEMIDRGLEHDWDFVKAWDARIANGTRLFGKYYGALWD